MSACPCGTDHSRDPACSSYFVTVINGEQVGRLAGPYDTHAEALADVEHAREAAIEVDGWAVFFSFGTVRVTNDERPGVLNEQVRARRVAAEATKATAGGNTSG